MLPLLAVLALAPTAHGAVTPRPLDELLAARSALKVLAGNARSPDARQSVLAAATDLGRATTPTLWLDPRHVVAPEHGLSVFSDSRATLVALEHVAPAAFASGALSAVETRILTGDRAVTEGAIVQALGGDGGLLARASGMVLSGDRWAQTSRLDLAAEQYGAGWMDAFAALTGLVVLRATSVSLATLGAAGARALRDPAIVPVGVGFVRGRRALQVSGKPEVLFVGTESCRFCGIERWGLVVALSRFGTFSGLHLSQSETTAPPVVRSFTFAGARYQSPYLSFTAVDGSASLGRLTGPRRSVLRAVDPTGVVPFVDVANRTRDVGATASPTPLAGTPWGALAASLRDPRSKAGQTIAATAEVLTAEICRATGGQPAPVCRGAVVRTYSNRLARFGGRASGCAAGGGVRSGVGSGATRAD